MGSQLRLDSGAADTGQGSPRIAFALLTAGAPSDSRKMCRSNCQQKNVLTGMMANFLRFDRWTYQRRGKCP